ncbi:MAG: gliding motility-associated C-terminal domain-containing protein [Crocinitomicaceae bacterium]|nr:gliding motility-associated C-terminal domain-containing protein [Crocinitomicaceae bacterium]
MITDPIMPTASNPAPVTVECIADVPAPDPTVVIDEADNNGVPTVAFVSDVSDGLTCPETITRTYSVTDNCANVITVTQTITVNDITNPTGTAPANITVQCIADVPAADVTLINDEADNCTANPDVQFVSDVSDGNTCPETITRTYSITDDCGNSINVTQTIVVDDTTNPTATAPANITVQCIADVPVSDPTLITDEADNCSVPTVAFVSDASDGNTCPETITRTYSITDACGNTITVTQTIVVDDTTNPTASNPSSITVPGGPAPAPDPTVVVDEADNCTLNPTVAFVSDVTDGNLCPETITRTYSVTDNCGNQITVTQLILITDPIMPTASNPAPVTVECIGDVPAADPTVVIDEADNNGVPTVAFVSDVSDGNTCPETITRTYSVTDACANVILVTQTITVNDITNPTGTAPANVTVQCIADVPVSDVTLITDEADNCTANPVVAFVSDVSDGNTCPETITRTYSITDDCGNTINVTQTIVVDDTTNPTATAPANITVQCIADVPAADPTLITDEADNCSVPTVAFVSDASDGNTCPETITRTYSITDACGNMITVTQTIVVDDTTNPTASNPASVTVPGGPVPAPDPTVVIDEADNCTLNPTVAFVSDVTDGNLCPETITRTYSVTDNCGNQITVTQTILITDPIMPTASNPAPVTVECIADVPAADPTVVIDEADNNGVPTVAFVSDVSDGLTCPETITRTYSVTDACANQIMVTQQIMVNDITNPTGTAPANITVQCIADVPAADVTLITDEADNCTANPDVQFVSDVSDGNTCPETITRTYSITDDCSNTINVTQTIVVDDTTNPTATAPANITVECIGDVPAADPTLITDEADNCTANPTVAFVSDVSDGNTCPETITRTYSITDDCGNTITVTQTIVVDDTTNPTASNPASITVPGGPAPAPDPTVVVDEADNCTLNPTVAFVSDVTDGNLCPETITRTYSVTDNCGNQITVTQLILITDPIMPTASNPAPVTVECIADVPAPDPTVVIDEADNNGVPTVAFVSDVSDGLTCPETITRTYSVTDACANQIMVTQQIIVNDITNPTGTAPANITVQCIADVPAADVTLITDEADNCTANPDVQFVSDVSDGNTCPETITRTYSITDDCSNTINVTQLIIVDDTTNPTASNPASVTVECIADVPAADPLVVIDEADNCSVPTVAFVSDASDGNTCPETITRTYSVTDNCGNTINVTQTIVVDDTTNPTASNPASVTVDVIANVPAADPLVVIDEADNCTLNPTVTFVSDVSDGLTCPETITRTYSVTDNCGNQITVTQTIIVSDIILPTASNPAGVTVECIADVPVPDPLVVIDEADNGGVPTVAFVSDVSDGNTCPETITRTYSVTDNCANQIMVTQQIIVNDITNPTGTAPANIAVQCIADVPVADVTLITDEADNCTANPDVQFVSDVSDGNTCPETITRTYSITDDCGNTINVTQLIIVDDTTNPTASNPASVTVECIADVPAANPAVVIDEADNCTASPLVQFVSDVSDGNTCPETITRTYSVTDNCGNQITVTQQIIVNDITNPTASNPAPINVSCASSVPAPNVSVVIDEADNCTASPVVAWVSDASDNNTCNGEIITRTYSVTDNCGNQITVTQQIIIGVTTPTVNAGVDVTLCEGEVVTLTASNPDAAVISWDNGVINSTAFTPPVGTTTYTVTATQCGGECSSTDQVDVVVNPLPDVVFMGDVLIGCDPLTVNFTNQTIPAGDNCTWNFGDGNATSGCGSVSNTYLTPGVYDVSLTVTTLEGCTSSASYADYITVIAQPEANFTMDNTTVTIDSPVVQFTNESLNADNYVWDFGDGSGSLQTDPEHTFPQIGNMEYTVTLVASNYAGCSDTATATIEVQDVLIFYVPNVFTPDGDGNNNTFYPVFTAGFDAYDYHLTIFNRWGEIVFESYNSTVGWDGTYGSQGLVEDGVYVWQIEFGDNKSDKRHRHRGHVTVLK